MPLQKLKFTVSPFLRIKNLGKTYLGCSGSSSLVRLWSTVHLDCGLLKAQQRICVESSSLTVTGCCQPFFGSSLAAGVRPPSLTTWAFPKGFSSHANRLPPGQVISKRIKKGECAEDRPCRVFFNLMLEMTYHRFYPPWLVTQKQLWHGVGGEYAGCEHQKAGWWGHLGGWLPQWYLCLVFLSMLKYVPSQMGDVDQRP